MFIRYGVIEAEAARKVIGFEAIAFQNPGGYVTAQAALADHIDRLAGWDLVDPLP